MRLLIDGYNLLHFSGLLGKSRGPQWLPNARRRMLQFLQSHLPEQLHSHTLVVFDASTHSAVAESEHSSFGQIRIRYSNGYENADELIEQLIAAHPQPKILMVVSSDHRIQRCARAHRSGYSDCESWLSILENRGPAVQKSKATQAKVESQPARGLDSLSESEVQFWLKEFGISAAQFPPPIDNATNQETVIANSLPQENTAKPLKQSVKRTRRTKTSSAIIRESEPVSPPEPVKRKSKKPKDHVSHRRRAKRKLPDNFHFPESTEET